MPRDSKTTCSSENFYSRISSNSNQQIPKHLLNINKLSQFLHEYREVPSLDMELPLHNNSMMQNFRKNFVNEVELILPTRDQSNVSQKRISEYFPEVKNINHQIITQGTRSKKRSLQELQMKYDSVQNMVANLSKETSYLEKIANNNELTMKIKRNRSHAQNGENKSQVASIAKKMKNGEGIKDEPTFIHLVGHVDNILRWNHILQETKIVVMYNVLGYFISTMDGIYAKEKFVFIRSKNRIILECSYFEIDRPLPKISKDQFVGCFGHLIGAQRFRLFSIDVLRETDSSITRRALCLSQRMAHELSNRKSN